MYRRFGSAGGDRAKRRARGRSADSRRPVVARGGDGDNTRSQHPISHAVLQVAPGKQSKATEAHVDHGNVQRIETAVRLAHGGNPAVEVPTQLDGALHRAQNIGGEGTVTRAERPPARKYLQGINTRRRRCTHHRNVHELRRAGRRLNHIRTCRRIAPHGLGETTRRGETEGDVGRNHPRNKGSMAVVAAVYGGHRTASRRGRPATFVGLGHQIFPADDGAAQIEMGKSRTNPGVHHCHHDALSLDAPQMESLRTSEDIGKAVGIRMRSSEVSDLLFSHRLADSFCVRRQQPW